MYNFKGKVSNKKLDQKVIDYHKPPKDSGLHGHQPRPRTEKGRKGNQLESKVQWYVHFNCFHFNYLHL